MLVQVKINLIAECKNVHLLSGLPAQIQTVSFFNFGHQEPVDYSYPNYVLEITRPTFGDIIPAQTD
jgi:hypothetical protein